MRIAVAGSTGRVGRHVVDVLKAEGQDVVPVSRSSGVDLITCEGLANALIGVDRIIDVASWPSPDQKAATEFFTTAALHLQEPARFPYGFCARRSSTNWWRSSWSWAVRAT